MNNVELFSDKNTSFSKQQNPLKKFELPCDREYTQMNIGACSYFLLSEYPVDIDVYISLNPEFKDAFKVDNRNTGFRINEVYTPQGVPSFVKDVYLWTKGITNLTDSDGTPKKVRIVTSGLAGFEILNNSSINSISSIGEIGRINGMGGYPQGALIVETEFLQAVLTGGAAASDNKIKYVSMDNITIENDVFYTLGAKIIPSFQDDFLTGYAFVVQLMKGTIEAPQMLNLAEKRNARMVDTATKQIIITDVNDNIDSSLQVRGSWIKNNLIFEKPEEEEGMEHFPQRFIILSMTLNVNNYAGSGGASGIFQFFLYKS